MNQDLHATHQILAILEASKTVADRILDNLPGLYITCDPGGNILRANVQTAVYLEVSHEDLLGVHISRLFRHETWQLYEEKFQQVVNGKAHALEFELVIDGVKNPMPFYWQISPLDIKGPDRQIKRLYSLVARDISELKKALNKVFSLGRNLELARAVQSLLLPSNNDYRSKVMNLAAQYEPAEVAGGDWWYFQTKEEREALILLGDVTGHGAGSAMVTSLVSGAVHAMMDGGRDKSLHFNSTPIFEIINESLMKLEGQPYWMTLFAIEINFEKGEFVWRNAAAPPVYHLKHTGELEIYQDASRPLGAGELSITTGKEKFSKGDRLLLFTDGVFEMEGVSGTALGQLPLLKTFMKTKDLPIEQAKTLIDEKLKEWRGPKALNDDAAFVVVDLLP